MEFCPRQLALPFFPVLAPANFTLISFFSSLFGLLVGIELFAPVPLVLIVLAVRALAPPIGVLDVRAIVGRFDGLCHCFSFFVLFEKRNRLKEKRRDFRAGFS